MSGQKNMFHRKKARKEKAHELIEARAKRSDKQQLAMLDKMFGKGKGAQKERARLLVNIEAAKPKKVEKEKIEEKPKEKAEKKKAKQRRKEAKEKK